MSFYICSLMTFSAPRIVTQKVSYIYKIGYRSTFSSIYFLHKKQENSITFFMDIQYGIKKTYRKMWNIFPISLYSRCRKETRIQNQLYIYSLTWATGNNKVYNKLRTNRWQVFVSPHLIGWTLCCLNFSNLFVRNVNMTNGKRKKKTTLVLFIYRKLGENDKIGGIKENP